MGPHLQLPKQSFSVCSLYFLYRALQYELTHMIGFGCQWQSDACRCTSTYIYIYMHTYIYIYICVCMWMDGWMDGWMDRWMDRWMDGRIVVCI